MDDGMVLRSPGHRWGGCCGVAVPPSPARAAEGCADRRPAASSWPPGASRRCRCAVGDIMVHLHGVGGFLCTVPTSIPPTKGPVTELL